MRCMVPQMNYPSSFASSTVGGWYTEIGGLAGRLAGWLLLALELFDSRISENAWTEIGAREDAVTLGAETLKTVARVAAAFLCKAVTRSRCVLIASGRWRRCWNCWIVESSLVRSLNSAALTSDSLLPRSTLLCLAFASTSWKPLLPPSANRYGTCLCCVSQWYLLQSLKSWTCWGESQKKTNSTVKSVISSHDSLNIWW